MFNVQTINCMQYSETVVIQTRSQSRNQQNKLTQMEKLVQKHNNFLQLKRSYLVLNEEKRKQERKGNRIITLDSERTARRLNDNITLVSETSHTQNKCENHKAGFSICSSI